MQLDNKLSKTRQQAILSLLLPISNLRKPIFACARGNPRAASSPVASAAGGSPMYHGSEIEVLYWTESNSPSDSDPSAKPDRTAAEMTTAAP